MKDNRKFFSMPDPQFQKEFIGLMVFVTLSAVLIMLVGTYFMTREVRDARIATPDDEWKYRRRSEFANARHLVAHDRRVRRELRRQCGVRILVFETNFGHRLSRDERLEPHAERRESSEDRSTRRRFLYPDG